MKPEKEIINDSHRNSEETEAIQSDIALVPAQEQTSLQPASQPATGFAMLDENLSVDVVDSDSNTVIDADTAPAKPLAKMRDNSRLNKLKNVGPAKPLALTTEQSLGFKTSGKNNMYLCVECNLTCNQHDCKSHRATCKKTIISRRYLNDLQDKASKPHGNLADSTISLNLSDSSLNDLSNHNQPSRLVAKPADHSPTVIGARPTSKELKRK